MSKVRVDDLRFRPCAWEEIRKAVAAYIRENRITVDSFWEDHVTESNHYIIVDGQDTVGFFAIHDKSTIMLFYVAPFCAHVSQELFARVKKYEQVTNAMVVTGDESLLSHCFDNFARIEKQAYFSIYTDKELEPDRQRPVRLRLADVEEDAADLIHCGDFLDGEIERIKSGIPYINLYIAELEEEIVGYGVIQYGSVVSDIASIGMFVREECRGQGVAASILKGLQKLAESEGFQARSGCWYYNHNSKKSMESAGAYIKSRLIRFYF